MISPGHNSAASICAAFSEKFAYGDLVPREWFWTQVGYDPESASARDQMSYMGVMERIHEGLRTDHKMVLQSVEGAYLITRPEDHAGLAERRLKNAIAAGFAEANRIIAATDLSSLGAEHCRILTDTGTRMAGLKALIDRKKRDPFG